MIEESVGSATPSEVRRKLLARLLEERGLGARPPEAIPRRDPGDRVPLSLNQEGLWFIEQFHAGETNYNIPGAVRLTGRLHIRALEHSLSEIVQRHEALRTTFATDRDGVPRQVIAPPVPIELPVQHLDALPAAERESEAVRFATNEARRRFDLESGPLFRVFLLRLSECEHVLVLNIHHIVCDGWSMGVITRELERLYPAFCDDQPSPLDDLPIQFADFVVWERDRLRGAEREQRLVFWKTHLGAPLPTAQLVTDRPRPRAPSFQGSHHPIKLSNVLTDQLKALSRQEGATLFMTLLAAFRALLCRWTGEPDVVVGTSIANRDRPELEGLIGYFATLLPLRTDLEGNPTFVEIVRRVRTVTIDACANSLPPVTLVKTIAADRDVARNPLFQMDFTLLTPDHNPAVYGYGAAEVMETVALGDLTMTPFRVEYGAARFDVSIFIWDMPQGLGGTVEYSTDLFDASTVARMVDDYRVVLNRVVAEPDIRLGSLVEHLTGPPQRIAVHPPRAAMRERLKRIQRDRGGPRTA